MKDAQPDSAKSPEASAPEVEVRYIDESSMKLRLLDEKVELVTKHGVLMIPVADVRKVEFATRLSDDVAEKIGAAVHRLGHQDFKTREQATAALKNFRERAYPMLVKATRDGDPEVVRRSEELIRHIREKVPSTNLEPRGADVVYTEDSKITGKLATTVLRVHTFQFGEQRLKLADVRSLRSTSAPAGDDATVVAVTAPTNLVAFQNQFGKELLLSVTGNQNGGGVWGSDVYTLDSNLAAAAVHAGLVQPSQTTTVRVRIVASPMQFVGSLRNGINTAPYGPYTAGAFEFVKR
jgi:hypothetical protein